MPRKSVRQQLIADIDTIIWQKAVWSDYEDDSDSEDEMMELLELRAGIESCRYLSRKV